MQLIQRCITVPDIGYLVAWGVSANTRSYWNNAGAARLGYHPVQNAEDYAEQILRQTNPLDRSRSAIRVAASSPSITPDRSNGRMRTVEQHAQALANGTITSRALVEHCLARIADPNGEGSRALIKVHAESARAMADAMDNLRRTGRAPSRYAGIPISLKDLFDIADEPTPAGSRVLADAPAAAAHAPVVQRMLAAGFVPVGRTNMTEFAFSGLGINPHYGTPLSPWDRTNGRIPGGSSSGTAVSVSDGMAVAGLGTDTGGSCRIRPHSAASSATSRRRVGCQSPACCHWRPALIQSVP